MSSNPIKRDFSKNQIKILKLLFEKEYLQNELQEALNTTAPNLHYHLSRLEGYNLIKKKTLHEVGSAKINEISLNPSTREYVQKLLGYKNKKSARNNTSKIPTSKNKSPHKSLRQLKNNYHRISLIVFLLCLTGIIVSSSLLFSTPLLPEDENSDFQELLVDADIFTQVTQSKTLELTANADIFTQTSKTNNVELTADADVFTQKTKTSDINVYDGSGATPFLRLGLYEFTYDSGGYISEIYVRFNLPKIENISSMVLQFTYREGYPVEADDYYDVNVSLVSNDWIEGNTVWTERPEYLGTSDIIYLHNPGLESEVYLNITDLAEGITNPLITIHLCPNNLSKIRFPAPFYSSESYGITPLLILEYEEPVEHPIKVYDGSGATPFLRLGLYEFTYDSGGYITEIYVRFNLPKIKNISSMVLQFTYWEGYPVEADDYYDVNVSLVSNDWVEGDTVWTERPEYLGISDIIYLHNPGLESEVYLNITDLAEGIAENMITVRLCPNNLSKIRFPAPFYSSESYGITPKLILEYEEPVDPSINVYDYSVAIPFLRLGLYEYTFDEGGYLSEMYLRFNLPDIEKIGSMNLRLSYWEGYPIEADSYYEINASLVVNNWVEETTTWTERPEYLGTSTLIYLDNPSLQSEVNLDLTNLVKGITETMITIRLCPHNLTRIRFPAPFKSSESDVITPKLILEYTTTSQPMIPNTTHIILIILLVVFGSLSTLALSGLIYKMRKHETREIPDGIIKDSPVPVIKQQKQVPIVKEEISDSAKPLEERKKKQDLCPHCGKANFKGWKFCTTCGKRMKPEKDSIDTSEFLGGFIISLIGGLSSIALGFGIPFVYPELVHYMEDIMLILQTIMIIGGVVSIIGAIIIFSKPKLGGAIVLVGGFIAGINIITIIGASRTFKKIRS